MGTIETFDHTADVGLRISGESLDDLLATAAGGVFDYIVVNRDEVRETETETFDLTAASPGDLLFTWLNELIFRCETRHRLYRRFVVKTNDDGRSMSATIHGEAIDPTRHTLDHEVKAVTYHGLDVHETHGTWHAEVILDI